MWSEGGIMRSYGLHVPRLEYQQEKESLLFSTTSSQILFPSSAHVEGTNLIINKIFC